MDNYTLEKTRSKKLFRVVDQNGNWNHYYYKPLKKYLRAVNYILRSGYTKGVYFEEYLKNGAKEDLERKLKEAGEKGDNVHDMIAYIFGNKGYGDRATKMYNEETGEDVILNWEEWKCIQDFSSFWERHECELVDYEFPVWNLKYEYAGTGDVIAKINKECGDRYCKCKRFVGKTGLLDWKSGKAIWDEQGSQVSGYEKGDNVPDVDFTGIVRLGTKAKRGYDFQPYNKKETHSHWMAFLSSIVISNVSYKPFDKDKIKSMPDMVQINLKRKKKKVNKKKVVKKTTKKKVVKKKVAKKKVNKKENANKNK